MRQSPSGRRSANSRAACRASRRTSCASTESAVRPRRVVASFLGKRTGEVPRFIPRTCDVRVDVAMPRPAGQNDFLDQSLTAFLVVENCQLLVV